MTKKAALLWLLVVMILSGCSGATEIGMVTPVPTTLTIEDVAAVETATPEPQITQIATITATPTATEELFPQHELQIEVERQRSYPGSEITFEQTLAPGANYDQYLVSYMSDGYKIKALMTIPQGTQPESGWPAIVFNHGYIDPAIYQTTERYVAYVDTIARNGYVVLKIDFRGHGNSDGSEVIGGGYGTPGYTDDALNALTSLQNYPDVDPNRIGMWGHSMGGQVTLRAMVVSEDIKAGVIWGGVVAPYPDIIQEWDFTRNDHFSWMNISEPPRTSAGNWLFNFSNWVSEFSGIYGDFDQNPEYWQTISPNYYLADLSGPIQLNHSTTDEMVPLAWSEILAGEMQAAGMPYEFYMYEGDNHNISGNFSTAMQRTVAFFDQYVKGE